MHAWVAVCQGQARRITPPRRIRQPPVPMGTSTQKSRLVFLELEKIKHDSENLSNLAKITGPHMLTAWSPSYLSKPKSRPVPVHCLANLMPAGGVPRPLQLSYVCAQRRPKNVGYHEAWVVSSMAFLTKGKEGGYFVIRCQMLLLRSSITWWLYPIEYLIPKCTK